MASSEPPARSEMTEVSESDEPMTEDEERWLARVSKNLRERTPEALGAPAKVFSVPQTLRDTKPESYTPHFISLGPYHQARPELMDMERFKLAGAKRVEMSFTDERKMDDLMQCFLDGDVLHKIHSTYNRTLNQNRKTLAWLMAIDACFLLDFVETYHSQETTGVLSSSDNWKKAVVRDAMMLENQIPLFVLFKTLKLRHATRHEAAKALHTIAVPFLLKDVSPIKITSNKPIGHLAKRAHLLEVLYHFLVPDAMTLPDANDQEPEPIDEEEPVEEVDEVPFKPPLQDQGYDTVKQAVTKVCSLNIAPVRFIKKKMAHKAPALAALVPVCGKLGSKLSMDLEAQTKGTEQQQQGNAPRADEISVPSVEELARCGVRFARAEDIAGIRFDRATATLKLPVVVLDANTEVVLRNLVAYEAVAVRGPLVLARYTELMSGIIDTSKDVEILERSGVVENRMKKSKKSKEAADMWNAMARATRLSRVPHIDKAIEAVNAHRGRSAAGRAQKLLKYVFRSWKMLTLLASVGLLVMTALQTFCSAYPCGNRWFDVGVLPGTEDPAR